MGASWLTLCVLTPSVLGADGSSPQQVAAEILSAAGVEGGFVVHLGIGEGRLTAALGAEENITVHGLEADPAKIATAQRLIAKAGCYGRVSVEKLSGAELPYADNLVNLVVVEERNGVTDDEIHRVLAPGGVMCVKTDGGWQETVKPRPENIDDWPHFLHDAGHNAVARDTVVGPPRSLQWVAPPLFLRSHETPSGIQGLVSAGGRVFYLFDEGLIGITDERLPERWSLICRDAFNGRLLWKRKVAPWGWPEWAEERFAGQDWTRLRGGRTVVPTENQQRLVAGKDRLYATLGFEAPLSILDAATGGVLKTVEGTEPAREILLSDGIVLVHSQSSDATPSRRGDESAGSPSSLIAVDAKSDETLWRRPTEPIKSLMLAIDGGRVFYLAGANLNCLSLADGKPLWKADGVKSQVRTLLAHDGVVLIYAGSTLSAYDGTTGEQLWQRDKIPPSSGSETPDLFVTGGVVWRGMVPVNEELNAVGKSQDAMMLGFDLRTGEQQKQIVVRRLRSPEHHHRCYRNKATERYIISGMEGAEFLDLTGDDHGQNNWLRGACRHGIMPCNGLLYVPSDQCFCQPGSKILGFAAVAAQRPAREKAVADDRRLVKGEAYASIDRSAPDATPDDWPTYRHDAARHGATSSAVAADVLPSWRTKLGGRLTAPVAAGGRVYVASCDAHTVFALDAATGKPTWHHVAGGRIDSPPTVYRGLILFGSADGRVYCLRASDGTLAWRFLAAPIDRRIGYFDQIESVWPVHGSVLIREGIAYVTAGRSTYLDGGVRVWGLDPLTGKIIHRTTIEGPIPDVTTDRDFAFYLTGANSDVLVAEGEHLYMRQKKLTPELNEVDVPVLSSKGAQDVGLHVFSTSGLLDGSWYNRTFWMYSKRWPGFQLANQAPKTGQILVVGPKRTFAVRAFPRRNVHSPMFFPGKEGYLLFADHNTTEPQIVGEPGARKAVEWLPQSEIYRPGDWGLDSKAFGMDKMIGYTRADPPLWTTWVPIRVRAMVKAGDVLFAAGPPDVLETDDPYAAFEGRRGARLAAVSADDGTILAKRGLDAPPVFDGLIAAGGRLFAALEDGSLVCLSANKP